MACPSRAQLQYDTEPTGVLEPHSNVSNFSASDHSDILPDPVQVERELAHEALNRDLAPSEQDDHLKKSTISYEEALQRELEYQKRIKMVLLQHPSGTGLNLKPSKELPSKPSVLGVKRKAVSGETFPPELRPPQPLLHRPPPSQKPQHHKSPLGRSINQQPLKQQPNNKQTPNHHEVPIWCNLCKVKCVTPQNLMSHKGGKKHKARMDQAFGRKKVGQSNGAGSSGQAASSEHKQGSSTSAAGSGGC